VDLEALQVRHDEERRISQGLVILEKLLVRDLFEDETQREVVLESSKADYEVSTGTPLQ
jgi:hypothetical protein